MGAIADGIGGLKDGGGAAAAAIGAVETFTRWLFEVETPRPDEMKGRIEELYDEANQAIVERAGGGARSGTTLVFAAITEHHLLIANVGDSRAWLFHDGEVDRLTEDHSVVEELVRDGALSPEQAARSPYRNLLTRSLGDDTPEVDVDSEERGHRALEAAAAVILTSDGAHGVAGVVDAQRITSTIEVQPDLNAVSEALCQTAVDRGSKDNATVVILRRC